MYTVICDARIFQVRVAPDGENGPVLRVFEGEAELIRHIAAHVDTHGCADPGRWTFPAQNLTGTDCHVERQWNWARQAYDRRRVFNDVRYTDADGRVVDVRAFRDEVIRAVREGDTREAYHYRRRRRQWRHHHRAHRRYWNSHRGAGGHCGPGAFVRMAGEVVVDEAAGIRWRVRGKVIEDAREVGDWDFPVRKANSTGWKRHKFRHQWEHRVAESEKHGRARGRKAFR